MAKGNLMNKVSGGSIASYVGVDSVMQLITSKGLYATIAASNETAGSALALVFLVASMLYLGRVAGVIEFSGVRN